MPRKLVGKTAADIIKPPLKVVSGRYKDAVLQAETEKQVITAKGKTLFPLARAQKDQLIATGFIVAYVEPGTPFGKTIKWVDEESKRWVFDVPAHCQEYRDMFLVIPHPYWVIETDGNNRIIHVVASELQKRSLPKQNSAYSTYVTIDDPDLYHAFYLHLVETISSDRIPSTDIIANLIRRPRNVGPLFIQASSDECTYDYRFDLDFSTSCITVLDGTVNLDEVVKSVPSEGPVKTLRGISQSEMAVVVDARTGEKIRVPAGHPLETLSDVSDFPFSCYRGSCGVCIARVISGKENLFSPDETERDYLDHLSCPADQRLLCLAVINGGEVTLEPLCD